MAEGFELYHVPQQTRRDKLRTTDPPFTPFQPPPSSTLLTCTPHAYDDLLTCANQHPPNLMIFHGNSPNTTSDPQPTANPNDHHHPQFIYPPPPSNKLELYSSPDPMLSRQALSLSLSSNNHNHNHHHQPHQTLPPMEVNFQYQAPPGPFTGYTSILKDSVFLRPAQLLLQEMCDFGGFCNTGEKIEPDPSLLDPPAADDGFSGSDDSEESSTISRLIAMLDEVYRRYRQYCQHLQAVVASFESIPGLNNAAPFVNFALKSLSKHFKCLKTAITDQLHFMSKSPSNLTGRKHGQSDENDKYFALYSQRPAHNSARNIDNQPIWRPQRGLPERAVSVLRSWLFEHFLHPYPTDTDKMMLAKQTGLSRNQVSNWFINARVRLWKPMVEEIHALETHQQGHQTKAASSSTAQALDHGRDNPSSSSNAPQDANYNPPEKRVRNELVAHHQDGSQLNMQFGHPFGVGSYPPTNPHGGISNGVSLTLALHQNNHHGMNGLLEPYPTLALAHRYGLSGHDGGGFSTRDVMGGQMSHDFIG